MVRLFSYFIGIVAAAYGLSWLADRPGNLVVNWQGYELETSVFRAIVMLALLVGLAVFAWSILKQIFTSPAVVGHFFRRRRQMRGLEALSSGMIAVGAGDKTLAARYALQARKSLPNEPLTHLLRAQTAQLTGDKATARRIFESMRNNPETELLGLRGLYLEARTEGKAAAARMFAERAVAINPKLGWPIESMFAMQCKNADWPSALDTLATARKHGLIEKKLADRRRAVLLTAQAVAAEEADMARALSLSLEANGLAPELVPAAAIAGRLLASQGATPRAAKILKRAWRQSPHPELAMAYAYARIGDSPRDRLARVKELAQMVPHSNEGQIAVAAVAIEAQDWDIARRALQHLIEDRPSQRVCTMMARIEGGQHGNTGRVREWLARAVHAPRDPVWIADGHVSSQWSPVSPVTGELDAYRWKEPTDAIHARDSDLLLEQLSARISSEPVIEGTVPSTGTLATKAIIAARPDAAPARDAAPALQKSAGFGAASSKFARLDEAVQPAVASTKSPERSKAAEVKADQPPPGKFAPPAATHQNAQPGGTATRKAQVPVKNGGADMLSTLSTTAAVQPPPSSAPAASTGTASPKPPAKTASGNKTGTASSNAAAHSQPPTSNKTQTAARTGPQKGAGETRREQKIFVPPRAPDDPGPEAGELDEGRAPMTRFRMPPAKGPG